MIDFKSLDFGLYNKAKKINEGKEMAPRIKMDFSVVESEEYFMKYRVLPWQEMRIDLVMSSIYGDDSFAMEAMDVILTINQIDNPLNIKAGTIIYFPKSLDSIDDFRYQDSEFIGERENGLELLGKANKNTRIDKKRKAFIENGYALPPTVNRTPVDPVRIESGSFVAGGIK